MGFTLSQAKLTAFARGTADFELVEPVLNIHFDGRVGGFKFRQISAPVRRLDIYVRSSQLDAGTTPHRLEPKLPYDMACAI